MEVTVQKQALEDALRVVRFAKPGSASQGSIPILGCVRLCAKEGRLAVRCTDIDSEAEIKVDAEVSGEGIAVLPAKTFFDLVRILPDGPVVLKKEGNGAAISYNGSQTLLNGYPAEMFPEPPDAAADVEFVMSGEKFKEMYGGVSYAVSSDRSKPMFTGVFFDLKGGRFRMVATDTYRLAYKEVAVQTDEEAQAIVPGVALEKTMFLLSGETVVLSLGKTHLKASTVDATVILRLIAGVFPNYENVIPREYRTEAIIDRNKLEDALKRAVLLTDEESRVGQFVFRNGVLAIETRSPLGMLKENIPVELNGEDMDLYFNCNYLLDALRSFDAEKAALKLTGPLSAALILPSQEAGGVSLLLPARPKEEAPKEEAAA
jgi:DNA polymerase-3 subunit beta